MRNLDPAERIERLNKFLMEQMGGPIQLPPGGLVPAVKKKEQQNLPYTQASSGPMGFDSSGGGQFGRETTPSLSPVEKQEADVQRLRAAGNKNVTRFYPRWNVRGDERVNQLRGYLDYLRADPDRLALYKQQRASASSEFRGQAARLRRSFAGRPEAEVQSRLADYNRQAQLGRIAKIAQHSPGTKETPDYIGSLIGAAEASAEARKAEQNLASQVRGTRTRAQLGAESRAAAEREARQELATKELTQKPEERDAEFADAQRAIAARNYPDMESRRAQQLSRTKMQ